MYYNEILKFMPLSAYLNMNIPLKLILGCDECGSLSNHECNDLLGNDSAPSSAKESSTQLSIKRRRY